MSDEPTKPPERDDDKRSTPSIDIVEQPSSSVPNKSSEDGVSEQPRGRHLTIPPPRPHYRSASPDALSIVSAEEASRFYDGPAATPPLDPPSESEPPTTWKGKVVAFSKRSWAKNKGVFLVILAQVFATMMNVTAQILEIEGNGGKGLNPFQVLFARMSITTLLSSLYMWYQKTPGFPLGPRGVRWLLVARGVGGFFGVFGMYYSLLYLPLADATVITFLSPSIACWACSFFIKEPFTRKEQLGALVSFIGVILIARPTALFAGGGDDSPTTGSGTSDGVSGNSTRSDDQPSGGALDDVTPEQRAAAVGVALVGVMGAAIAYTTMRWIGSRAHPLLSVNYFSAWCTVVSTTVLLCVPSMDFLLPSTLREWGLLGSLGICGFIMQFLLSAGLQAEKSSRATNMVYTQMFFALGMDKLVWGTTPGVMSIIGSSLILGSAVVVAMRKQSPQTGKEDTVRPDEERGLMEEEEEEDLELVNNDESRSESSAEGEPRGALMTPLRMSVEEHSETDNGGG